ncbi:CCA1, partial [Symbiodinium pilosum]
AFCGWQLPTERASRPLRAASGEKQEIVYNYFAQDYALVTRKEKTFDVGQWLSELLPWSDGEQRAREVLSELLPKWRSIDVGPQTDIALRRRFRALAAATGGEETALAAMRRNIAVLYFGEGQIQQAGEVLRKMLGKERAAEVIRKNPGVLTIAPRNLENNIGSVCLAADVIDVLVQNGEVSRLVAGAFGLFFVVGIAKALGDVVYLRVLDQA